MVRFMNIGLRVESDADGRFSWSVYRNHNNADIATSGITFSSARLASNDFERQMSMWMMLDKVVGETRVCPKCGGKNEATN